MIPLGKEELCDRKKVELSQGTRSDHLMFANVMMKWEDAVQDRNSRKFCWEYFLAEGTLQLLDKMKKQFAEQLAVAKFIGSSNVTDPDSNRNSGNEALVRAVICAGLYPNVAAARIHRRGSKRKTGIALPKVLYSYFSMRKAI